MEKISKRGFYASPWIFRRQQIKRLLTLNVKMGMLMFHNNIIMCPQSAEQKVDIYF